MTTALTPEQIKQRLRYQGKQYGAGAFSRGYGYCEKHYLEQAADCIEALEAELAACKRDVDLVRSLLWDAHPECCGCPVVGAEYMGAQEMICCGNPSMDTLNDGQIVNTLRAKFPAIDAAMAAQEKA